MAMPGPTVATPDRDRRMSDTSRSIQVVWTPTAQRFFDEIRPEQKQQVMQVLAMLETTGVVSSVEKFKSVTKDLWEVKAFQVRILGAFRPGGKFLLAHGFIKKTNMPNSKLFRREVDIARRVIHAYELPVITRPTPVTPALHHPQGTTPPSQRAASAPQTAPPATPTTPKVTRDLVWALVNKADLLPPDAPLMLSLSRFARVHNIGQQADLMPFMERKLLGLPIDARVAMGLVDDLRTLPYLKLGAMWGVEYLALTLNPEDYAPAPPAPEPVPVAAEAAPPAPEPAPVDIFVLHHGHKTAYVRPTGDVKTRTSHYTGLKTAKKYVRTYSRKLKVWFSESVVNASDLTERIDPKNPIVAEALSHWDEIPRSRRHTVTAAEMREAMVKNATKAHVAPARNRKRIKQQNRK